MAANHHESEGKTSSNTSSGTFLDINGSDVRPSRNTSHDNLPLSGSTTPDNCLSPPTVKSFEQNGHVNVKKAEAEFEDLNLELRLFQQQSSKRVRSHAIGNGDLEKGATNSEPFDLEATLRGDRAEAEDAGAKFKRIGVSWKGLTVKGNGGSKIYVQTFPNKLVTFFNVIPTIRRLVGLAPAVPQVEILKSFTGYVRPGEMVLVLGRPSSGCTSFLKVISNQRFGYTNISGEVRYGQFDHSEFSKLYRGEAVYNAEDESSSMLPTLTVGQTLDFALNTKLPNHRPAGLSKKEFKEKVITMLLRMFNIEHTRNTMIGGMFVRGVSGGERKRASIAEMMVTNAAVCSWDSPTRGLDASTAVDYVRSIRVLCDIHHTSTFITAYQVSESIYCEFDKVLLIDNGRQVYFGPAKEARAYFEGLGFAEKPRQTTADYLTGCTDPNEREYGPHAPEDAPSTTDELADCYNRSSIAGNVEKEMQAYETEIHANHEHHDDFLTAIKQSKRQTSHKSVYSIPFYMQVWALMKRQFILKWQDKFSLCVSWITVLLIAMILSTVWVNLPENSSGAFVRGGVIFISFLFNGFQAFGELVGTMLGRPVVNKHRSYAFYRPSALWIAQIFVDVSFQSLVIFAFSIMVYFSTGLARTPGAFFTFVVTILCGYLAMTVIFRTIGILSETFDIAIRTASIVITFLVLTSGYPIQWDKQQVWIRWIFWINPAGLGFSTLMLNEFKRIDLQCIAESLIPSGQGYNDISHQVCTLLGSERGNPVVSGKSYIETTFSIHVDRQWLYFSIIVILIIGFLTANVILGEFISFGAAGRTVTVFVKENSERRKANDDLKRKQEKRRTKEDDNQAANISITSEAVLTWEHLDYDVPIPGLGPKRILNDIFGYCKPGQLTALMGASGAGKTTLLDVLASRKNIGVISGEVLIDGNKPGIGFQRGTSYAEQMDTHMPTDTVREALRFSAELRQSYDTSQAEKYAYVEEIISLLELESIADAIIGSPEAGLAPDQRKLVTIGVELAAKPQLLLFLDEPTTGLDSQSAWNIARFLRKLTAAGQAVLCTIHQPNSALFQQFDRLLLLQRGGECVYFGEIGDDAKYLRDYFHRNGADCPPGANPAEWMLDAIGAGLTPALGDLDWGEVWRQSSEFLGVKDEILQLKKQATGDAISEEEKEYATPIWHQMKYVVKRQSVSFWRTPNYGFTRLFNHVTLALMTGVIYVNLGNSRSSLQDRVFLIFQVTVLPALILAQVQPKYAIARSLAYKEQAAKTYRTIPFALSMVVAEVPYNLLCAVSFFLPLYYIPGLRSAPKYAGYQFFMILIVEQFSVSLGQMIGALTPSPKLSSLLNPPIMICFALFAGVTIPYPQMPVFWRSWLYHLAPFSHLVSGMMVTELHDNIVECRKPELQTFTAPENSTCGEYMDSFFRNGGFGYLVDNATNSCEYCAYRVGDEFYRPLGYSYDNRWRELGILSAYIFSTIAIVLLAARYLNFNRR